MSQLTEPVAEALTPEPSDALWTADSERSGDGSTPELAPDTPEPVETPETPAVPETPVDAAVAKQAKARNNPYARMKEATAKEAAAKEEARIATERATRLESELQQARQARPSAEPERQPPTRQPERADPSGKPKWKDFEDQIGPVYETWPDAQDAYNDARDAWKDGIAAERQQAQAYGERAKALASQRPDFAQVVNQDLPVSAVMRDAILQSEMGPDISYYLGTHPEVCTQLAHESQQTGRDAVGLMRRYLESQVSAGAVARPDSASTVRPSNAKPPVNRVGGTASATPLEPDDLEFGPEYIRQENAREKKAGGSRW